MNSNETPTFQLPEETFDDVEGHGIRGAAVAPDEDDDTEGHATRVKI